ncbi:MAG: exodeoxyribonuclease VII small subunit [Defluviitaleaceae bacterium]|nr:exodeoxyribonuclease VII small subunit [Defluviitaleaceae bacterium]MCL2239051.1 exodeoxyribonuclease VII small subunit [Defluviitaleaceae bacterium]
MTFETSMKKLASITEEIESPATSLEAALALYKEGIALAKECGETLSQYASEVLSLQKEGEDIFALTPFGEEQVNP